MPLGGCLAKSPAQLDARVSAPRRLRSIAGSHDLLRPSRNSGLGLELDAIYMQTFTWALATMSSMGYGGAPVAVSTTDYLYSAFMQA